MPMKSVLVIGSGPGADLPLQGHGVAPRHAQLAWRDGLWLQDLGAGRTTVDGRVLAPNEAVQLAGFHAQVLCGASPVPLTSPEVSKLFIDRSALRADQPGVIIVGRDPARAHAVITHPTVSGVHLRVDLNGRSVTDLQSKSGTFDRNTQRLPPNSPVPMDPQAGYSLGAVWVPSQVLMELAGAAPGSAVGAFDGGYATSQGGPVAPIQPPIQPVAPHTSQHGYSQPPRQSVPHAPGPGPAPAPAAPVPQRTMFGSFDLASMGAAKPFAIIGRAPECDIVLPFPQVSSRHTSIMRAPDGANLIIGDMKSTNGTYVNGQRLAPGQNVTVPPKTRIFVGPYQLVVDILNNAITAYVEQQQDQQFQSANLVEIEALDLFLDVPDRDKPGTRKVLLNHVTFKALPGDLIALMGPSGAGKTTLLTVLNGYFRPSSGEVRVNGENLYAIYDALRGSIGYVPQDDLLHPELTVREAIAYSARFRLPADFSDAEIEKRVQQTMKDLSLENLANTVIGSPIKKVLSGGQRKRVNIALELVTDPALMFLDEPTSGLAADDTVALIDLLSNLAKQGGKTIIVTIHQPAREEYEKFNLAFIMGFGGEPVYYGPTGKASYDFFSRFKGVAIDNPRDMFDQLKVREEEAQKSGRFQTKAEARLGAAQEWRREFFRPDNTTYQQMFSGRREPGKAGTSRPPSRVKVPLVRQLGILLSRYIKIKARDRAGLAIMLLQAPIIGGLLGMVFRDAPPMPNLWCQNQVLAAERALPPQAMATCAAATNPSRFPNVEDLKGAIFFLTVGALWFGVSNAAREIVSEIAIYRRERMVSLSIFNYMMSKFIVLSVLCVVQCTVLLGIVNLSLNLGHGSWDGFLPMLATMILSSMCAVSLGLLISAVVQSSEAAMALTPIALIPQVVLGGLLVPMTNQKWLKLVMALMPSRWSFEGVIGAERETLERPWQIPTCVQSADVAGFVQRGEGWFYNCAVEEIASTASRQGGWGFSTWDSPFVANGVLTFMTLAFLGGVAGLLRKRDSV
ncbi:MAG: ATP-binding cassette domain-containing protein [Deltaproteobacteria bacterium]|nr:ATP-binding cassette domain-containing protein [Deltaproteobacteria bacterium]